MRAEIPAPGLPEQLVLSGLAVAFGVHNTHPMAAIMCRFLLQVIAVSL